MKGHNYETREKGYKGCISRKSIHIYVQRGITKEGINMREPKLEKVYI